MIGVVITIVVCITIGIISTIRMNRSINRIKELEQRLNEYYIQREKRLKDNELINDLVMGYISNKGFKIIEAVGFILMVVSIITLLCVAYEVNKVSKDIKVLKSMTIRK